MGNTGGETRPGRSAGPGVSSGPDRVREVAQRDKDARFTALLHHVSYRALVRAFDGLKKDAAPGADGVTWREYDGNWQENLLALHSRVQSGKYRVVPSRRVYIPKADGRLRPLGIATVTSYCLSCSHVSECSGLVLVKWCWRICWHEHGRWCRHFRAGSAAAGRGAPGCGVEVPGCGDAVAAGGLEVVVPGDA